MCKHSESINKYNNDAKNEAINESKDDERWIQWMKLGEKTGCHQRCDRSFYIKGRQFPVCARCTGLLIAYVLAIVTYICGGCRKVQSKTSHRFAVLGCLTMLLDWSIQALKIKESTNVRRLITGFLGGLGLMHFYKAIIIGIRNKGYHVLCRMYDRIQKNNRIQ